MKSSRFIGIQLQKWQLTAPTGRGYLVSAGTGDPPTLEAVPF